MKIDFGIAYIKKTGEHPRIKITLNKWKNDWLLHIREWNMDGDTGELFPTNKGIALDSEYIGNIIDILTEVEQWLSLKFKYHNQLEFNFDSKEDNNNGY